MRMKKFLNRVETNPGQDVSDTIIECMLMERLHIQPSEIAKLTESEVKRYISFILVADEFREREMKRQMQK